MKPRALSVWPILALLPGSVAVPGAEAAGDPPGLLRSSSSVCAAPDTLLSSPPPSIPAPPDLRGVLSTGFILQDRNGDGHPDFVHARIVIPGDARGAEVAAAANVAARLSFEGYATDLDLLRRDGAGAEEEGAPVLGVGRTPRLLEAAGIDPDSLLEGLAPGEGMVVRLRSTPALPEGGVWVVGADATGLLEAAGHFAGRLPAVWDPEGPGYDEVGRRLARHLEDGGVSTECLRLERAVVSTARPGVARLRTLLPVTVAEALERARELLAIPEEGAGAGGGSPDPRDVLVPGLHRLDVALQGPTEGREEVHRIRPDRPWEMDEPEEWQAGNVSPFTLSDLYTLDGIYRDTRGDLIPDRTEAYLSVHGGEGAEGAVNLAQRIALETAGIRLPLAVVPGEEDPSGELGLPVLYGVGHPAVERLREEGRLGAPEGRPGEGVVELVEDAFGDVPALVVSGADVRGLEAAADLAARRLPHLWEIRKGAYRLDALEEEVRRFFQGRGTSGQTALALQKLEEWLERLERGERPGVPPSDQVPTDRPEPRHESGSAEPDSGEETRGPHVEDAGGATRADSPGSPPGIWRPGWPLGALEVDLVLDSVPSGLEAHVDSLLRARFPETEVEVGLRPAGFGSGELVFQEDARFDWEVDEVRRILREEVYPALSAGEEGRIRIRVSEPPEVRQALESEVADSLRARGLDPDDVSVTVLSAYKQGFSWIEEEILPRLRGREVGRVEIDYRHLRDSDEVRWNVVGSDTRWLQELFPIDAVLARELEISEDRVVFRATDASHPVYRIRVLDPAGEELLTERFDPAYGVRPYFDLHPDYERVRVTTGRVEAEIGGRTLLERRVPTDLERFWDFWQGEILPRLRDYVLDLAEGELSPEAAPFFDELAVEVRLSEPNRRIGIDEEVISALESVHNDLYFHTLAFFSHLGEHYGVGPLRYPGRILPRIDPTGAGEGGWARVTLTGRTADAPELALRAVPGDGEASSGDGEEGSGDGEASSGDGEEGSGDGEAILVDGGSGGAPPGPGRWRYPLTPLPTEAPPLRGAVVGSESAVDPESPMPESAAGGWESAGPVPSAGGKTGSAPEIRRLLLDVVARDSVDRRGQHRERASEEEVDRALLPLPLLEGMVERVRELHGKGILEEALAFEDVGELALRFRVEDAPDFRRIVTLPRSRRPASTRNPVLESPDFRYEGQRLVQWHTPIPPEESDSVMARLSTFSEAEVYFVGRSYLGQPIFAADFLPPVQAELRSQAKLNALRPTALFSGRQHANEVSSTSHLLRLGELLATDPDYRELLQGVNVVLHPITNPDGARLAYEMQKVNPDFTLHAGYLGALGVDVTAGAGDDDPVYPESKVRPDLLATWLPDVYINMHGYPSHEWVQHFSGYAAWVRGRTVTARTWWAPRGWFIPGFRWVDDPEHPEIRTAQFSILDTLAAAITGLEEVEAMNRRQYRRYAKYGRQDVDGFREHFHEGMLVYLALRGEEAEGEGPRDPRILTFSATTEAPDETARGEWLELVASAGLAHSSALVRYLATGVNRVQRETEAFEEGVHRSVSRKRPVLPPDRDR